MPTGIVGASSTAIGAKLDDTASTGASGQGLPIDATKAWAIDESAGERMIAAAWGVPLDGQQKRAVDSGDPGHRATAGRAVRGDPSMTTTRTAATVVDPVLGPVPVDSFAASIDDQPHFASTTGSAAGPGSNTTPDDEWDEFGQEAAESTADRESKADEHSPGDKDEELNTGIPSALAATMDLSPFSAMPVGAKDSDGDGSDNDSDDSDGSSDAEDSDTESRAAQGGGGGVGLAGVGIRMLDEAVVDTEI